MLSVFHENFMFTATREQFDRKMKEGEEEDLKWMEMPFFSFR